jgi:hypothetical protein
MSSICIERRDRNQVKMDARRIETTGGMIGDLILSGEQLGENPPLKGGQEQIKCQAFQLIRVFGTHRGFEKTRAEKNPQNLANPRSSLGDSLPDTF